MKILLFTKSITLFCLLLTEVCSSENFLIVRDTAKDSFTIPPSKCDKDNDAFDYCSEYNATAVRGKRCECVCHDKQATFSVYKQSWSCLKNEDARTSFGCSQPAFFEREKVRDKLSLLKSRGEKYIDLTKRNCQINTISSWYIDCEGKKVASTGSSMENLFEIEEGPRNYDFEVVGLPTSSPLAGRIINLGISCRSQSQQTDENYCLLFKLTGTTSCPVTVTQPTRTTEVVDSVLKSAPPEVLTPPSAAADQSFGNDSSSASLGVILGVTVGIILFVLLVATLIYRKHDARKHPRTSSEGQISQSESGSRPRDQNEGYETLSTYTSAIYTSTYHAPNGGGSEEERAHLRSPRSPTVSNGHVNNGLDSEEPFYSTVDELCSECSGKSGEYVDPASSERSRDFGPFSVEQRVYNMMEVLNTNTSESPYDYGSNEGNKDHVPFSVKQRVSNMIEVQNTDTSESSYEYVDPASSERSRDIGPLSVEQRAYNMIEDLNTNTSESSYEYVDPASSERSRDIGPLSVEQRVYNMIEALNTDTSEGPYEYVDPTLSEKSRDIGPLSVEQCVYNMIEDLNTNTLDSPYDYASNEGKQNHVPLSVEQRVYNLIEGFDIVTEDEPNSSDPSHKETPVYKVLEEPLPKSAKDTEKTCFEKDPVYNVLEGPDPEKTEDQSSDTLYNTKEQDNNSNTLLYAVA